MKVVQLTLDEELVAEVDQWVRKLGTSRSSFTREALRNAILRKQEEVLEEKHRRGYEKHSPKDQEFGDWESEQAWGDE